MPNESGVMKQVDRSSQHRILAYSDCLCRCRRKDLRILLRIEDLGLAFPAAAEPFVEGHDFSTADSTTSSKLGNVSSEEVYGPLQRLRL